MRSKMINEKEWLSDTLGKMKLDTYFVDMAAKVEAQKPTLSEITQNLQELKPNFEGVKRSLDMIETTQGINYMVELDAKLAAERSAVKEKLRYLQL
jgi:hypothetical protein